MNSDLKKEIEIRDELIAGLERENRLRAKMIEEQKQLIQVLEEHISQLTDIINNA